MASDRNVIDFIHAEIEGLQKQAVIATNPSPCGCSECIDHSGWLEYEQEILPRIEQLQELLKRITAES